MAKHMALEYRPEIDGMRAIAAVSVILYHAKFAGPSGPLFQGGYLGVDIFFVISGYLISRLILFELHNTGGFRFGSFYERRLRRIPPILVLVILASFPVAWFSSQPNEFREFSLSAIASVLFVSNFFFLEITTDYGATSSLTKPLLHTWSLGIEEQFYLVAPLCIVLLYRARRLFITAIVIAVFALSLATADYVVEYQAGFAFFNPLTRVWEFLLGLAVAILERERSQQTASGGAIPQGRTADMIAVVSLAAIAGSLWSFDDSTRHPGLITVLPVGATAALLLFTQRERWIGRLLANPALAWCGLISFSLYMWHFPVLAFARQNGLADGVGGKLALILFIVGLSYLSYRFVEQPFRSPHRVGRRVFFKAMIMVAVLVTGASAMVIRSGGFPDRFERITGALTLEQDNVLLRKESWRYARAKSDFAMTDDIRVLVAGNSH
ncbi:MAG: acyltransferase, partial [Pseudomonadota bacterium]